MMKRMALNRHSFAILLLTLIQCIISPTVVVAFTPPLRNVATTTSHRLHAQQTDRQSSTPDNGIDINGGVVKDVLSRVIRPTTAFVAAFFMATLSSQPVSADDGTALPPSPTSTTSKTTSKKTAYDETWTLIKKYALDQSFHGQNWDEAYKKYSNGIDLSNTDDEERIMKATKNLVGSLDDKYSRILDKNAYAMIQKFDLIGVGATLMPDPLTKEIIVGAPPVAKSAADEAGIKAGDIVFAVNGVETMGRNAFDIIDQISDNPNSGEVTFTIRKRGSHQLNDVVLKRAFLEVKDPVSYRISETRSDGTKVGYIRIVEFNSLVKPKLEAALRDLESQGVDAYVLDVRGNPGGAFQSAVEIAGLFLSDKLATDVVDGNGVDLKFRTSKNKVVIDEKDPIAIWVDGRSASASEVLAGALRDNCRAVVMGDTSFGKGLVQAVYGLENGYGLVLTVAKYLTPKGTDINKVGIVPDVSKEDALPSAPGFVPIIGSDTSRVDFNDVLKRMDPSMCSPIR
jgi:carboxyl-terminal processing protease